MHEPDPTTVHGLANHLGALLLGLDVLRDEEDLPDHARVTLGTLLDEARAATRLVHELQRDRQEDGGDGPSAPHP